MKVTAFDGLYPCGGDGAEGRRMEVLHKFGSCRSLICVVALKRDDGGSGWIFQGDAPESVGWISMAGEERDALFLDGDGACVKLGNATSIAHFAD